MTQITQIRLVSKYRPQIAQMTAVVFAVWIAAIVAANSAEPSRAVGSTAALSEQGRRLEPRDQSDEDAEFAASKRALLAASERGDLAVLRAAIAPRVKVDFEEVPRDVAVAARGLAQGSPWRGLRDALRLGVVREADRFVAPYVFAARGQLEPDEAAITGRQVNLRSAPAPTAPVVAVLSFDIVRLDESHRYQSELFEREDHPAGTRAWAKIIVEQPRMNGSYSSELMVSGESHRWPLAIELRSRLSVGFGFRSASSVSSVAALISVSSVAPAS